MSLTIVSKESGFSFSNKLTETVKLNYFNYNYLYNGNGVAIGDINRDGLADIYMVGALEENKLFLNKGDFIFEDITNSAKVSGQNFGGLSTGVTMADVNHDGYLDIYVCKSGPFEKYSETTNLLFVNDGKNHFEERAKEFGLADRGFSIMASFFDYDKDGYIDMYLLNHPINFKYTIDDLIQKNDQRNADTSDKLFHNNGDGTFTDVSEQAGLIGDQYGFGLGVSTADLSGDGWPDIYVSNDFSTVDYYYVNQGDGTFKEMILSEMAHISNNGMGCDIADFNNDLFNDLIQVDMKSKDHYRQKTNMPTMRPDLFYKLAENGLHHQYMVNTLQINNQPGRFSEIAELAGVSSTDWSWAALFCDLDNNGWKDLFITNGIRREMRNNDMLMKQNPKYVQGFVDEHVLAAIEKIPSYKEANTMFSNDGNLVFKEQTKQWGVDTAMNSNGAALADLDNDGDLDIVVNNLDFPSAIYKNNAEKLSNNYLQVKLQGSKTNPFALGAAIYVFHGKNQQLIELQNARGYMSSSAYVVHFGLGKDKSVDSLKVVWNDGNISRLRNVTSNQRIEISHKSSKQMHVQNIADVQQVFNDITRSSGIDFVHHENDFNDFQREILLPHKMSTCGPFISVGDVDLDGLDDFFVGGAKDQAGVLFIQKEDSKFIRADSQPWNADAMSEDMGCSFFDLDGDGDLDLYVASGGNEFDTTSLAYQDRLYINQGDGVFKKSYNLPEFLTSSSCVTRGDFDSDGDDDLFVGGRQIPGKYPFPAKSYLLENIDGKLVNKTEEKIPELAKPGMVTQAVWSDFNMDGQLDLVVVGEWMEIGFYKNVQGHFINVTEDMGLGDTEGLWFSIECADIDGDGDDDFLLGNLGLNSKIHASEEKPYEVFCNDFDGNGSYDIVLGKYSDGKLRPARGRECSSDQMPFIKEKFETFDAFANSSLEDVLPADKLTSALNYRLKITETCFLENLGNSRFSLNKFPIEAQFSAVFGFDVNDYDKDGNTDIVMTGNFFGAEVETTRHDASIGEVFTRDESNKLTALGYKQSGFYTPGNARDMQPLLLGQEKTPGLLVANNNGAVQLFSSRVQNLVK